MEIVFSVSQESDGGFVAECLSHDIFTEGDSWDELRANVQEAVNGYFYDETKFWPVHEDPARFRRSRSHRRTLLSL